MEEIPQEKFECKMCGFASFHKQNYEKHTQTKRHEIIEYYHHMIRETGCIIKANDAAYKKYRDETLCTDIIPEDEKDETDVSNFIEPYTVKRIEEKHGITFRYTPNF